MRGGGWEGAGNGGEDCGEHGPSPRKEYKPSYHTCAITIKVLGLSSSPNP